MAQRIYIKDNIDICFHVFRIFVYMFGEEWPYEQREMDVNIPVPWSIWDRMLLAAIFLSDV